jgi:hypothetical protein
LRSALVSLAPYLDTKIVWDSPDLEHAGRRLRLVAGVLGCDLLRLWACIEELERLVKMAEEIVHALTDAFVPRIETRIGGEDVYGFVRHLAPEGGWNR